MAKKATRLQGSSIDNNLIEYRKKNRTSVAGAVCKRRVKTLGPLVRQLLYPRSHQTKAIEHGHMYESVAIAAFVKKMGCIVDSAGLFIHKECGFLGAGPDGIVIFPSGEKAFLEIKCPLTVKEILFGDVVTRNCRRKVAKNYGDTGTLYMNPIML